MSRRAVVTAFFRSREGSGLILILLFAALLSAGTAWEFYQSSLRSFTENKSDETITALKLVDAFVNSYAKVRSQLHADQAPVPATFRAHSIELFNQGSEAKTVLHMLSVGPPGRAIKTPPTDAAMGAAIEAFAGMPKPKPSVSLLKIGTERVFRTIYPSIAKEQSCVDCHNQLQPDQHWKLNDVMGGLVIDAPVGPFLRSLLLRCLGIAFFLFTLVGGVGAWISLIHYRRLADREAGQARIEESEKRFRDFAEASSDWFWEQDEDLRMSFVSDNDLANRLGSNWGSYIGKTRRQIIDGVSPEQWQSHDADLAARRPFQKFRFQRVDVDGEVRHVELNGKPIFDFVGNFKGYRGTGKDITVEVANEIELTRRVEERTRELHAVQDELLRKERLSTLGQFTATVAHELRNPLSAIRNTAFAIAEAMTARGLRLDRPMSRLDRSIARCDRLIADLLEYTRMRELKCLALPLDFWLGEVLDEQKMPDGIVLRRDFAAAAVIADFDPDCLRRVVINLVENASQALAELPPAGSERQITVATRSTPGAVTIAVADTGPGIAAAVLPKVFDPLFSTKSFGTGLGLPTVKQIIDQHGGTIEIASEPGHGTRVVVSLPVRLPLARAGAGELAA